MGARLGEMHHHKLLATAGAVRKLLDPACGTGGMFKERRAALLAGAVLGQIPVPKEAA